MKQPNWSAWAEALIGWAICVLMTFIVLAGWLAGG